MPCKQTTTIALNCLRHALNWSHRIHKLIKSLPIEYDYLSREFDKMSDDNFKIDNIKTEIINEFNHKEIRDE